MNQVRGVHRCVSWLFFGFVTLKNHDLAGACPPPPPLIPLFHKEFRPQKRGDSPASAHGICLSSQPANSFHPNTLIVSDLLIDEDGQIVAVIVKVGGFLGMGAKEVAIFLDSVEPSLNEKDKGYDFGIRSTEDTLREAPELTDVDSRPLSSQSR
ncbi:PRC-barrel domain-containing protein [Ectothiorhodospira shaposhnikovii]|uniref:PRC-barrel domain-containing protein n=1 Tax=Ectothiorhodospira shaposhnikovii TaxID=1054 RepID=UPI0039A03AD5